VRLLSYGDSLRIQRLSKPKSLKIGLIIRFVLVLAVLLGFNIYAFRNFMVNGVIGRDYMLGGDGMAHVYKVEELLRRMKEGIYVDWTDAWYLGYHPYHFYPPLSYSIYALIAYIMNDTGLGIRVGVALSFFLSSLGFYLSVMEITRVFRIVETYRRVIAVIAAIFYSYHPYMVNFSTFVNDLPAAFSFSFLAFSFYFYLRAINRGGLINHACSALFLAGTFLAHPYPGFFAGIAMGLYAIFRVLFSFLREICILKSLFLILLMFLGFISFWIIPYYYEAPLLARTSGYEWTIPILSVRLEEFFDPSKIGGWAPTYLGISAILIVIIALVNKRRFFENLTFLLMLIVSCYMALGVNAPIASLNPLLALGVYPDRAMVLCVFCLALGLAFAVGSLLEKNEYVKYHSLRRFFPFLYMLVMFSATVDSSSISPSIVLSKPIPSFNDVCYFIKDQGPGDGRVFFIGPDAPVYSYSPSLTGRALTGGYYLQGSKITYLTEYVRSLALKRNETAYALTRFEWFNVEYIVVDREYIRLVKSLLDTHAINEVYRNEKYVVYKFLKYKGLFQPAPIDILVVGQEGSGLIVKSILEKTNPYVMVVNGHSKYIDDYSLDELLSHDALVLYSFAFHSKDVAESLLRKFVESGKRLVIDMDGFHISAAIPNIKEFMGVIFERGKIYDDSSRISWGSPFRVTYSEIPFNISFSEAAYFDSPWDAVTYKNYTRKLLEVNGVYDVVVSKGDVLFVGLNLFYHALLYNNVEEMKLLEYLCVPKKAVQSFHFEYEAIRDMPHHKTYSVNSTRDAAFLVSLAWSPHLQIRVNGTFVQPIIADNLIRIDLPKGYSRIDITYTETAVHHVSMSITLLTVMVLIIYLLKFQRRFYGD